MSRPVLLEAVGAELVEQPDPAALLGEVEQHALPLLLDHRQRRLQLLAAIAAQAVEDVAREALEWTRTRTSGLPATSPLTIATWCLSSISER